MQVDQPAAQPPDLGFAGPLPLGQAKERQRFGLAVVQDRPIGIGIEQTLQAAPEPGFTVLLQGQ